MKYCNMQGAAFGFVFLSACAQTAVQDVGEPPITKQNTVKQKEPHTNAETLLQPQRQQTEKKSSRLNEKSQVLNTASATQGNAVIQTDFPYEALSQDVQNVLRLLTKSSIARKIKESQNPEALAVLTNAKSYFDSAVQARRNGDDKAQKQWLAKAKREIFQAAKHLQPSDNSKTLKSLENRMQSAKALLSAYQRIAKEKSKDTDSERFAGKLEQARAAYQTGDLQLADSILGDTFLAIKKSLIQFRNGETVVHQLHFDTPEDEFRYELDRNKTHKMLFTVLQNSRGAGNENAALLLMNAEELREDAMKEANHDVSNAIKIIEKSTREIIKAIRALGIYIPG